jgi:hypothetical protein
MKESTRLLKETRRQERREDIFRALEFLKANPWLLIFSGLVISDFLRYLGVISKAKSSDISLLIAGLGVATNGGGLTGTVIAGLVGGTAQVFPDTTPPVEATKAPSWLQGILDAIKSAGLPLIA